MPQHAAGRGAQAKLLRGSKRAFFACVGEAGPAGSNLQSFDRITEPVPPSVGALVFLGFLSSGSTSKKFSRYRAAKTASEQDLRIPERRKPPHRPEKAYRRAHSGQGDLPPKFFRQERAGKIRVPVKTPWGRMKIRVYAELGIMQRAGSGNLNIGISGVSA
jgi:hypothetical protein